MELEEDTEGFSLTEKDGVPGMVEVGYQYFTDVRKYYNKLKNLPLRTDISADIMADRPWFSPKQAEDWEKAIKEGVRLYRIYEDAKNKVVDWVMKQELPLVVADDQYEMGENETYIESDDPIVIQRFKKIVAYSNQEKDKKAVEEKYAKDHNLQRPSDVMKLYKKALINRDWKVLLGVDWKEYLNEHLGKRKITDLPSQGLNVAILSEFDGIPKDGQVRGVIVVEPQDNKAVLLSDYQKYKGLEVSFGNSENLQNATISFVLPQQVVTPERKQLSIYATKFPIYFSAEVVDKSKPVKVHAQLMAELCREMTCEQIKAEAEVVLEAIANPRETSFATYIRMVGQNIPLEVNEKNFKFRNLFVEKGASNEPDKLRLELEAEDAHLFNVFIVNEIAQHFAAPVLRIDGEEITAKFDILTKDFNPLGQELTFWCSAGSSNQYLKQMVVQKTAQSYFDEDNVSVKILVLAFVGGLLLNLMPCVFPVLSLKLLAFTKFGGLNKTLIRRNFIYNSLGIMTAFVLIAVVLSGLKMAGYALGWGMQFQNIYFLCAIIWVVVLFLAYVLGFINLRTPAFSNKILDKTNKDGRLFEFLSGVFLVVLSTPCMAPYLGTAFGVALAGSVVEILLVVTVVGMGLATPYILIAVVPDIAFYMPKPGKWINTLDLLMFVFLVITIGWLVSILAAQTATSQLWHWALYILGGLITLFMYGVFTKEINKLEDKDIAKILQRRANCFFGVVLLLLMSVSTFDAARAVAVRQDFVQQTKLNNVSLEAIRKDVEQGGKVLVKVGADWCLTCKYNDNFVFDLEHVRDTMERQNVKVLDIDWTSYEPQVLEFMQKFGRRGLPFYVLFSPRFPDGIMLPEMPNIQDFQELMEM